MNRLRALLTLSMVLVAALCAGQDTLIITNASNGLEQRIAYDDIITVQPQGSDDRALIVTGPSYGTVTTIEVYDDVISYQSCRLLDFTNRISGRRTAVPYASVDTVLNTGAQGGATINVSNDRFGYAAVFTSVEKYNQVFSQWAECDAQTQRPVFDVVNVGYGRPIGKGVVDGKLQLRSLVGVNGTVVTERAGVLEIDGGGGGGGGGGATNLTVTQGSTSTIVESSSGTNATIFPASATISGVMTAADKVKLDDIESGATADQTDAEIVTAVNNNLGNTDWQSGGGFSTFGLGYSSGPETHEISYIFDGVTQGPTTVIPLVNNTQSGLMPPADKVKLDGIEAGATADQTGAEIVTEINAELGGTDWQTPGGSNGDFSLTSGAVVVEGEYIGNAPPTITNPSAGEYTIIIPAGTRVISMRVFGNNTTLTGSNEFILRVDHSADAVNRLYTIQQFNASTGARSNVFSIGTNETQNVTSNVTQITFPGMNGYGSSGFYIALA